MGFLDSLLSQGAKKIISEVADAAINAVKDEFASNVDTQATADKKSSGTATKANKDVPAGYEDVVDELVDDKLRAVFAREFPQYEVKENVSPTTIGGTGEFMNYSFGVYEDGVAKLFIMIVGSNDCARRVYRLSKEQAEYAGVTMINFVEAFENRIDYIINRLHQYL